LLPPGVNVSLMTVTDRVIVVYQFRKPVRMLNIFIKLTTTKTWPLLSYCLNKFKYSLPIYVIFVLFLSGWFGLFCFMAIPCCVKGFKDVEHTCPQCHGSVAKYKRHEITPQYQSPWFRSRGYWGSKTNNRTGRVDIWPYNVLFNIYYFVLTIVMTFSYILF